jgi:hypothetical protein
MANTPPRMKPINRLRLAITIGAVLVAIAHLVWPHVKIDMVAVTLLVVAILPWLTPLVKSVELPGGFKIELNQLKKAESRADTAGLLAEPVKAERAFSFETVAAQDPNLALAGLRIEIERRLGLLAQARGLDAGSQMGVGQLLPALVGANVLNQDEGSVLADMTSLLSEAVHGADVDQRAAEWAFDVGPRLLASLDERVDEKSGAEQ